MSVLNGAGTTEMPSLALNIYTGSSFAAPLFLIFQRPSRRSARGFFDALI